MFTVGGWNKSEGFAKLSTDAKLREQFIDAAKAYCAQHGFDGIDYDWEHPKGAHQIESYVQPLKETLKEFAKHKLIVTHQKPSEVFVNKSVAVCPAVRGEQTQGISVVMPLTPELGMAYYNKVRETIAASEKALARQTRPMIVKPPERQAG